VVVRDYRSRTIDGCGSVERRLRRKTTLPEKQSVTARKRAKKQRDRQEGVLLNGVVVLRQGVRVRQGDAAITKQRLCRYGWLCNDGG
jgi:hypothetical protein